MVVKNTQKLLTDGLEHGKPFRQSLPREGVRPVAKKEGLGTKRACPECSAKFYDLDKDPVVCPKCGHSYQPEEDPKAADTSTVEEVAPKAAEETTKDETDVAQAEEPVVSFEDADEEAMGAQSTKAASLDDDEDIDLGDDDIEIDDDDDDVGIIADEDDFDDDVSSIIDADIEKED